MSEDTEQLRKELKKIFSTQNLKVVIKDYSSNNFYCYSIVMRGKNSEEYKHLYNAIRELEDENLLTDFSVRTIDKNF